MTDIRVPFVNLYPAECAADVMRAMVHTLGSRRYILGPEVEAFECEWAEYCGAAYCIGVGNGFDALLLALKAHGIERGDDVLVPSNTCTPTWCAVIAAGATPVPVEPNDLHHCITGNGVEAAITSHTRAVIPVHLYGQPCDLDAINEVAREHNIVVIEDCAQAHGATYRGRRIGGHGNTCCWSFYPTKNLGGYGDAGAVTTSVSVVAERVRLLRAYGCAGAVNSRMDEMQAAILRAKKAYLPAWNYRRDLNAAHYLAALKDAPGLIPPWVTYYGESCWHQFVVRHPRRDALRAHLAARGIETIIHYPVPPHRALGYDYSLPVADQLSDEVLSLPVGPHLSAEQIEMVIEAVKEFE